MFIFESVGEREDHPVYQALAISNLARQYDFLRSVVEASIALQQPMLDIQVIKAFNYHAISCLHDNAGEIRPCAVHVGNYTPPAHHRVPALMSLLVDNVNRYWEFHDPIYMAAYVLWRLNWIHPFINGNGRTARVVAYYIVCLRAGSWLPGEMLLPDLLRRDRNEYEAALQAADASVLAGQLDLTHLHALLERLLNEQLAPFIPLEPTDQEA